MSVDTETDVRSVGDLPERLLLTTDSAEIRRVCDHIDVSPDRWHSLFLDTSHGAYSDVWGVESAVPFNSNLAHRLK